MVVEIILFLFAFLFGCLTGWFITTYFFAKDPKYVMLNKDDVIVHKYDLELLVAAAPRQLKNRLLQSSFGKAKDIIQREIEEE